MKEVGKLVVIKIYNKQYKIEKCFTSLKHKYKIQHKKQKYKIKYNYELKLFSISLIANKYDSRMKLTLIIKIQKNTI